MAVNIEDYDCGLIYVRNRFGHVRAPAGYNRTSNIVAAEDMEFFSINLCPALKHSLFQPLSLFITCKNYIVNHFMFLESLVDFPDNIGKNLFDGIMESHLHKLKENNILKLLTIFVSAYQKQMLISLNLKNQTLIVENHLRELIMFNQLEELDLSNCSLRNKDFIISIGHMLSLKKLVLCNNKLTDEVIQRLTLPARIRKMEPLPKMRPLSKLQVLDISCNSLTDKIVRYLIPLTSLIILDLSGTKITKLGIDKLEESTSLKVCAFFEEGLLKIETKGWAKQLFDFWIQQAANHNLPMKKTEAQTFYGIKIQKKVTFVQKKPKILLKFRKPIIQDLKKQTSNTLALKQKVESFTDDILKSYLETPLLNSKKVTFFNALEQEVS